MIRARERFCAAGGTMKNKASQANGLQQYQTTLTELSSQSAGGPRGDSHFVRYQPLEEQ